MVLDKITCDISNCGIAALVVRCGHLDRWFSMLVNRSRKVNALAWWRLQVGSVASLPAPVRVPAPTAEGT
jgi:hypothetical protein